MERKNKRRRKEIKISKWNKEMNKEIKKESTKRIKRSRTEKMIEGKVKLRDIRSRRKNMLKTEENK